MELEINLSSDGYIARKQFVVHEAFFDPPDAQHRLIKMGLSVFWKQKIAKNLRIIPIVFSKLITGFGIAKNFCSNIN